MSCSGTLAPVHKPLMAVGQVSDEGNDNWISGDTAHPTAKEKHVRSNYTETPTGQHTIPARCSTQLCPANLLCNSCRINPHMTFVPFAVRVSRSRHSDLRVEQPDHTRPRHPPQTSPSPTSKAMKSITRPAECVAPGENKSSLCSAHLCSHATNRTFIFHSPSFMRHSPSASSGFRS